jgi:hypothetical protein
MARPGALKNELCVLFLQVVGAFLTFQRDDDDAIHLFRHNGPTVLKFSI